MFEIDTVMASIGMILATVSFITGLQVIKRDREAAAMMASMHRVNGYITSFIYIIVAVISLKGQDGMRGWSIMLWAVGLALILIKVLVVRNERFYKYGSRVGLFLFIVWLVIVYKHVIL